MTTDTRHDAFIDLVRQKLAGFDRDIDRLHGEEGGGLAVDALRKQRDHVHEQLGRLEQAGNDEWTHMRPRIERAVTNLNDTLETEKARVFQS